MLSKHVADAIEAGLHLIIGVAFVIWALASATTPWFSRRILSGQSRHVRPLSLLVFAGGLAAFVQSTHQLVEALPNSASHPPAGTSQPFSPGRSRPPTAADPASAVPRRGPCATFFIDTSASPEAAKPVRLYVDLVVDGTRERHFLSKCRYAGFGNLASDAVQEAECDDRRIELRIDRGELVAIDVTQPDNQKAVLRRELSATSGAVMVSNKCE